MEHFTCPACKKKLEKVNVCDVEVEACVNGCGGVWLDAAEIFRMDEEHEGFDDPVMQKLLAFDTPRDTDFRDKITCIKCGFKMRRREHREGSGIYVDECYGCGGIWLDGGELKAIRENPVVKRSNEEREQMAREFAQRIQEEKRRRLEEERLRKQRINRS
jgi:Zn-finger nucleic acid-binding protein